MQSQRQKQAIVTALLDNRTSLENMRLRSPTYDISTVSPEAERRIGHIEVLNGRSVQRIGDADLILVRLKRELDDYFR